MAGAGVALAVVVAVLAAVLAPSARSAAAAPPPVGAAANVPVVQGAPASAAARSLHERVHDGAEPGLQVSVDGVAWAEDAAGPIFPASSRLVPGDLLESTVWLRNASDEVARLGFSATSAWASSADFADDLVVSARLIGTGQRAAASWTAAAGCAALIEGTLLAPGETVGLRVGVDFSSSAPEREGAGDRATVDFVAVLRDPAVSRGPAADCSGTVLPGLPRSPEPAGRESGGAPPTVSSGSIASTGADAMMAGFVAVLAAGLVATGVLLLMAHSRARARVRPCGRNRP